MFGLNDADDNPITPDFAVSTVQAVLEATGLPLVVLGPGQAEIDNQILVPIADATKGERLVLGLCEDGNYRTIVAAAMANDHLVLGPDPDGREPRQAVEHPHYGYGPPAGAHCHGSHHRCARVRY